MALLDFSIANAPPPRGLFRRTPVAMELTVSQHLNQRGRFTRVEDGVPLYGYTRRQCEAMRVMHMLQVRQDYEAALRALQDPPQGTE